MKMKSTKSKRKPDQLLIGLLISLCLMPQAFASGIILEQQDEVTVTGTVTDSETGDALIGASVIVQGTSNGTTTNSSGEFSLDMPASGPGILSISYVVIHLKPYPWICPGEIRR